MEGDFKGLNALAILVSTNDYTEIHLNDGFYLRLPFEVMVGLFLTQDTPNPGTYEVLNFIEELNKKVISQSYTFKDQGRKKDADPSRKGVMLMPGQYKYQTFVDDLKNRRCYASFKGGKRFHGPGVAGLVDKVKSSYFKTIQNETV